MTKRKGRIEPCITKLHIQIRNKTHQNRYAYRHNLALQCLAYQFIDLCENLPFIQVFVDLPNLQASVSPPATIPPEVMVTSYRPDLVFYNTATNSIALLELTCPLDSEHHLQSARLRKQNKVEYQQLLAELDCLNVSNYYKTLEISVLGHYHPSCVKNCYILFTRIYWCQKQL